jgi:RNA-splicing ligase RtcB
MAPFVFATAGATRAFGPAHEELPRAYRDVGKPVLIPGSMGTASYVLAGTDVAADLSLSSACHGAGRAMSRTAARRSVEAHALRRMLEAAAIVVSCPSDAELAEEVPVAYKDVDRVWRWLTAPRSRARSPACCRSASSKGEPSGLAVDADPAPAARAATFLQR